MFHHQTLEVLQGLFHTGMVFIRDSGLGTADIGKHNLFLIGKMLLQLLLEIREELPYNPLGIIRTRNYHPAEARGQVFQGYIHIINV